MKNLVMFGVVTLSCIAAAPAMAKPARAADGSVAASTASTVAQTEGRRYCVVDTVTGSRIERKECRTRADWLKQGFDPLDPK